MSAADGGNTASHTNTEMDISGGAAGLYRSPTWARNINFDSAFDVNLANSSDHSEYISPADVLNGVAVEALAECSGSKPPSASASPVHSRNGSILSMQQQSSSRKPSSHTRQRSNSNMTTSASLRNSPTTSISERTTPKTSHFSKSSVIPILPAMKHQRNASASSANAINEWSRPSASPQLHSSADIYASNAAGSNDQNRNSASLSMMSGTSLEEIDDERRDSGADSTMAAKRASVLSFQTALSGMGGGAYEESPTPDLDRLDKSLPQRPWLNQPTEPQIGASSSFSTSPDERHLPGSWGNGRSAWNYSNADEAMPSATSRYSSPLASRSASAERMNKSPAHSPKMQWSQLDDASYLPHPQHPLIPSPRGNVRTSPIMRQQATLPIPSTSNSFAEQRGYRHGSLLRNDTTGDLLSQASSSYPLGPISGEATTVHESQDENNETSAAPTTAVSTSMGTSLRDYDEKSTKSPQISPVLSTRSQQDKEAAKEGKMLSKQFEVEKEGSPPRLPEKPSPPSVPSKSDNVGLSSPPLSDNVIPPPLPSHPNGQMAVIPESMPANRSPVLEFRKIPLMNREESVNEKPRSQIGQRKSLPKILDYEAQAGSNSTSTSLKVGPGVGAHALRNSTLETPAGPAFAAHMRGPSDLSNGVSRGVLMSGNKENPNIVTSDRSPSPTFDTPPREDSPPPEGEVEARAEWERAQLRRAAEREKKANVTNRKSTFKTQLKPLQLVTAEESKKAERKSPARDSMVAGKKIGNQVYDSPLDENRLSPTEAISAATFAGTRQSSDPISSAAGRISPITTFNNNNNVSNSRSSSGGMSTQQLQRQVARDQRYSVNAVNIALGQKGVSDIGGAYPVFQSPSTSAVNVMGTGQKYSGLMPQRSLVPPFELQNRPDGLPSALIGPDGIRRNPNDPEVCLECMMRDEDMIDVHVLGVGLWERESDRDFEEAIRLEAEEDLKKEKSKSIVERTGSTGTHGSTLENATASTNISNTGLEIGDKDTAQVRAKSPSLLRSTSPSQTRLTKIRVKRVAKGDPLTSERLKLHTQMSPPASSHRWRTLQTFLSIQARYIASEQKARGFGPGVVPKTPDPLYDNRMVRTISAESKGQQRPRVSSPGLFQVAEVPLSEEEKIQKERNIVGAREARRRNNLSGSEASRGKSGLITENGSYVEEGRASRLSAPMLLPNDDSTGHHSIPRRTNAGPSTFARGVSAQELRTLPSGMPLQNKMGDIPPLLNNSSLAPPMAPFRAISSTPSTPAGPHSRLKSASSQMSLAASGSMIDMHVGLEDGKEHRLAQTGFMPGTPLHSQSPSVVNRAFYGFPSDGEVEREDYQQGGSFGDYDDTYNISRESPEVDRKKKKGGLRSLFGGRKSAAKESSPRLDEEISREQPRERRRSSLGMDSALDLQPPPGIGGLLSRARRSTSSLLTPTGRQSTDSAMMLNNNPLMASQTSLELGPFGSGPLPPPRKDSRFSQALGTRPESPQSAVKEKSRLRTFSSGNLMSKKKNPPNPSSRTSSMMQTQLSPSGGQQDSTNTNEQQKYFDRTANDRSSGASLLTPSSITSMAPAQSNPQSRLSIASAQHQYSPTQSDTLPRQWTNIPVYPGQQQQQQNRPSTVMQSYRANRSEGVLPMFGEATGTLNEINGAPRRPPRSPHRETNLNLPEQQYASLDGASIPSNIPASLQKEQYYHAVDAQQHQQQQQQLHQQQYPNQQSKGLSQQYVSDSPTSPISPENTSPIQSSTPFRKSRLLKLPFGKNKRESASLSKMNGLNKDATPSLKSQNSRGTIDDLQQQQQQQQQYQYQYFTEYDAGSSNINVAFNSSSPSFNTSDQSVRSKGWNNRDRQQYNSLNITYEEDQDVISPRSQSALGVLDASSNGMRSFLPRLRTSSRAALRDVRED